MIWIFLFSRWNFENVENRLYPWKKYEISMHLIKLNMILKNQQQQEEQVGRIFLLLYLINHLLLVSIITIIAVISLSIIHIATFQNNTLKYDYDVDWDHDSKLKINVDMTIAMNCPCKYRIY